MVPAISRRSGIVRRQSKRWVTVYQSARRKNSTSAWNVDWRSVFNTSIDFWGTEYLIAFQNLVEMADCDPNFLRNIVIGDETWYFQYDPSTKLQTVEWLDSGEARAVKARAAKSKVKTILIVFFDSRGIIHIEFVPFGQTVNATFYRDVIDRSFKISFWVLWFSLFSLFLIY